MHIVLYTIKDRNTFKVPVEKITINSSVITITMRDVLEYRETLDIINENKKAFVNFYIYDAFSHCSIPTIHIEQIFGSPISRNIFMYAYVKDVLDV